MKAARTALAVLAIVVLVAAVLVPGGTPHPAVLAVVLLVLPLTLTLRRLWVVVDSTPSDPLHRSLALLRAPPATSIKR
jgi:hypothetical protein